MCNAVQQWPKQLNTDISEIDPEIVYIIERQKNRQWKVLYTLLHCSLQGLGLSHVYLLED